MTFQNVSIKRTFRWSENGKRRQRTHEFWQTVNPYNRAANGRPKSEAQIRLELQHQADEWLALCERAGRGVT